MDAPPLPGGDPRRCSDGDSACDEPVHGRLFAQSLLVIGQHPTLVEAHSDYPVYDRNGIQLGSVRQHGQGGSQKALRLLTKLHSRLTVTLEILDISGIPVLQLTRSATMLRSTVHVQHPDGSALGDIRIGNLRGRNRFAFEVAGERVGGMQVEQQTWGLRILDDANEQIGTVTSSWDGPFTPADHYALRIDRPLVDPLLSMVVAAGLTVDTALSQYSG